MAPRFYSKEWLEACIEKANNDQEYLKKTKDFKASFLFIVADCPDGNDVRVLLKFNKGKIVHFEYDVEPVPASFRMENDPWDESISQFRSQGSYDTYKKLQTKEMNPLQALGSGLYKTEGNMFKGMQLMPYTEAWTNLEATIECEY